MRRTGMKTNRYGKGLWLLAVCLGLWGTAAAQRYPERRMIRSGNREYEAGKYTEAEVDYRRALERNPLSYEAAFNLPGAFYKQECYVEAAQGFGRVAEAGGDSLARAQAYYNQGNALFKQRKLEEALEAYKSSLRLNPSDQEAKFNLAYTKKLLEKDKNGGGGGGGDDNRQNPQDQNDQQNSGGQDRQQNPQNNPDGQQNPDQGQQNPDRNPQGGDGESQPQDGGMSREEAERMLNAVQNSEDNTREKMEAQPVKKAAPSGKNW